MNHLGLLVSQIAAGADVVHQQKDSSKLQDADNDEYKDEHEDICKMINTQILQLGFNKKKENYKADDNVKNISEDADIAKNNIFVCSDLEGKDINDEGLKNNKDVKENICKNGVLTSNQNPIIDKVLHFHTGIREEVIFFLITVNFFISIILSISKIPSWFLVVINIPFLRHIYI